MYVFSATSISIIHKIIKNNSEDERRSGASGTGVSQKERKDKAKKSVEKKTLALQACSGGSAEFESN